MVTGTFSDISGFDKYFVLLSLIIHLPVKWSNLNAKQFYIRLPFCN